MVIFKFLVSSKHDFENNQVFRWTFKEDLNKLNIEKINQKVRSILSSDFQNNFSLTWFDGTDECSIVSTEDLKDAVETMLELSSNDKCVRIKVISHANKLRNINRQEFESDYLTDKCYSNISDDQFSVTSENYVSKTNDEYNNLKIESSVIEQKDPVSYEDTIDFNPQKIPIHQQPETVHESHTGYLKPYFLQPSPSSCTTFSEQPIQSKNSVPKEREYEKNVSDLRASRTSVNKNKPDIVIQSPQTTTNRIKDKNYANDHSDNVKNSDQKPSSNQTLLKFSMEKLRAMGFTENVHELEQLVIKNDGNLNQVIDEILKK